MVVCLLDTNILVDLLRGYAPALSWTSTLTDSGVSHAVHMELLQGAQDKVRQNQAIKLLAQFELVRMEAVDFDWATDQLIKHRLKDNVDLMDCLIGAVSMRLQIPLYTRNLKHFQPIIGALAVKPY